MLNQSPSEPCYATARYMAFVANCRNHCFVQVIEAGFLLPYRKQIVTYAYIYDNRSFFLFKNFTISWIRFCLSPFHNVARSFCA